MSSCVLLTACLRLSRLLRSQRQRSRRKQTVYRSLHVHDAVTHAVPLRLRLAQIGALFGYQNAIFVKHKINLGMLIDHV